MKEELESIISDRNLESNEYEYLTSFSDLQIHRRGNHGLLLKKLKDMNGYYEVYGNFLIDQEGSMTKTKLYKGIQLDLFYNKPPRDDLEFMIDFYAW